MMTDVSIIIPVYNAAKWINQCMKAIADQTVLLDTNIKIELVAFNDGSSDETGILLSYWHDYFTDRGLQFIIDGSSVTNGVGAAKNRAIRQSSGQYLCFQDIDDIMLPDRISLQLKYAKSNLNAIVGSCIQRSPPGSTPRLVRWANELEHYLLKTQIYTSNGPTILMPTWFCHRSVYNKVGGFDESGHGTPEDLIFFYAHLDAGGDIVRVDKELLIYTYHEGATTFSVTRESIWKIQLSRIEQTILPYWNTFTIWNAGKAGRRVVRCLSVMARSKIIAFCDVDQNKIGQTVDLYCPKQRRSIIKLPVIHFSKAKPPLLICMKLDLTNGSFERNLKSMNLKEGKDYVLFC